MIFREISQKISDFWELTSKYLDRSSTAATYSLKILILLSAFAVNSCDDLGCIEADDFGEYQTKTLVIDSKNNTDSCEFDYNSREDMESENHGSGLLDCLTRGGVTIGDEDGEVQSSNAGCSHWQSRLEANGDGDRLPNPNSNLYLLGLCADRCVARCNEVVLAGSSSNIEPNWKSTGFPGGGEVTLSPGTKISVRAVGRVSLGGEQDLAELYVIANVDSFLPAAKNAGGEELFLPVSYGDSLGLKFSGGFVDRDTSMSNALGDVGLMNLAGNNLSLETHFASNPSDRADLINASKRLVMHVDPFPRDFSYNLSNSRGDVFSQNDVVGSTLHPDQRSWKCDYTGNVDLYELDCYNDIASYMLNYPSLGADDVRVASSINSNFPISSDEVIVGFVASEFTSSEADAGFSGSSSNNGGILKTTTENQQYKEESTYDPFSSSNCPNQYTCSGSALEGVIVGDLSAASQFKSISQTSQIYFKYLQSSCAGTVDVAIKASSTSVSDLYVYDNVTVGDSWTDGGSYIVGENNYSIEVQRNSGASTFNVGGTAVDCGESLAIKFVPIFDFPIGRSGLVSFANLAGVASSGSCNLKFRIINPEGSHDIQTIDSSITADFRVGSLVTLEPDFYEYGDFNSTNPTPEDSTALRIVDSNWNSDILGKVYVRRGQKIRFMPESWSGNWTPSTSVPRKCGVGMAIRIEPRPAFLCRGIGSQNVRNPSCRQRLVEGQVRGCEPIAEGCSDTNSSLFCPDTNSCVGTITFDEPTDSVSPRSNAVLTRITAAQFTADMADHRCASVFELSNPADGSTPVRLRVNSIKVQSCHSCQNAMSNAALQAPVIPLPDVQYCYNLEKYKGKVENITSDFNGFFATIPAPSTSHEAATKGLIPLRLFAGRSGNLGDVGDEYDDHFVKIRSNVSFNVEGKLTLMILDGEDFKPLTISSSYSNNGVLNSGRVAYSSSHNNGFRVKLNKFLNFSNGENLEVLFCKESSEFSADCSGSARWSSGFTGEIPPNVVDFAETDNSFAFDRYGDLFRNVEPRASKRNCDNVTAGNKYFCHCRGGDSEASDIEGCGPPAQNDLDSHCDDASGCRYRLAFKINDPEVGNCLVPTVTVPAPGSCDNTASTVITTDDCNGVKAFNVGYNTEEAKTAAEAIRLNIDTSLVTGITATTGLTCNYTELYPAVPGQVEPGPSICDKQYKCASRYANNTGEYNVLVRVKKKNNKISGLVSTIIDPILEVMDGKGAVGAVDRVPGQAERIYKLIISDPAYKLILKMSLVLMVSFYGLTYLMGLNEGGTADIISRVVKIGLVLFFVSDQGWEVFNTFVVSTFKGATDEISFMMATSFDDSDLLRAAITNKDYSDKSVLFSSIDKVMGLFFAPAVQKKITALLFAGLFGWMYLLFVYYAFISYIFAVSTAVLIYLTAQVFISVLFVLGPIFFIFTLFNQTKEMFDKWLQQLIGFSLQQIFLLVTLSFFNMMMYEIIKNSLGYKVCWDEVWTINILITVSLMSFWTIPNIPKLFESQAEPGSSGSGEGVPSLFSILFIWIVAKLMLEFVTFMSNIAADIGGGIKASDLSAGVGNSIKAARKSVTKNVGDFYNKKIGFSATDWVDNKVFDSGKTAKKKREVKRAQDMADLSNKGALKKAGNEATHDYKKNNGAELAGMSPAEQQKKLNGVRDGAMLEKGNQLGLSEDQVDKLKNDRGVKYRGDNLAGYAVKRAYQKAKSGGSVSKSITHKDADRELTKKEAQKALKRTDGEGRGEMMEAVEKGGMFVKSGRWSKRTGGPVKSPRMTESEAHKHARQQLEGEKKIDKFAVLGGALRSNDDSKLIRDRMKENSFIDGNIDKTSRASTTASLKVMVNKRDMKELKEEGNEESITEDMKMSKKDIAKKIKKNRFATAIKSLGGDNGEGGKIGEFNENMTKQRAVKRTAGKEIEKLKKEPQTPENIAKIEDQVVISNKADNVMKDNGNAKKDAKNAIADIKAVQAIEKEADRILGNKTEHPAILVDLAKEAKKDINKFKERELGVKEGGYSKTAIAGAMVAMTPLTGFVRAISGGQRGDVTRSGILGARRRSTDESFSYLKDRYDVLTSADEGFSGNVPPAPLAPSAPPAPSAPAEFGDFEDRAIRGGGAGDFEDAGDGRGGGDGFGSNRFAGRGDGDGGFGGGSGSNRFAGRGGSGFEEVDSDDDDYGSDDDDYDSDSDEGADDNSNAERRIGLGTTRSKPNTSRLRGRASLGGGFGNEDGADEDEDDSEDDDSEEDEDDSDDRGAFVNSQGRGAPIRPAPPPPRTVPPTPPRLPRSAAPAANGSAPEAPATARPAPPRPAPPPPAAPPRPVAPAASGTRLPRPAPPPPAEANGPTRSAPPRPAPPPPAAPPRPAAPATARSAPPRPAEPAANGPTRSAPPVPSRSAPPANKKVSFAVNKKVYSIPYRNGKNGTAANKEKDNIEDEKT